ncbi:MAG TPA: stage II sporulation protein M [Thermoanaerobaculia bacterium]|nr:stage II sporulation protein M [Thermoanaerobaculia bacterium]
MDYGRFLSLRGPAWRELEEALARLASRRGQGQLTYRGLEAVAMGYRRVLQDLAFARSRFPASGAAQRLAGLALEGTRLLLREEPGKRVGVLGFFLRAFPAAVRRRAGVVALAVGLFLATGLLGFVAALASPALGMVFLGPAAIAGLEEGRMWTEALTTTVPPAVSSSQIATNNLSVSLFALAGGALAGAGSLWILFVNGLMLGAVIGTTLHFGMAPHLLEFISAHGPLELTVIVFSAAAGLVLAHGLVVAEDRPRRVVLAEGVRDALTIFGGCFPWLVVLAVVETLVSPAPEVAPALKLALGLVLEGFFLFLAFNPMASREARGGSPA